MREVAVVGAGMHKFGRFPDKYIVEIARDAILKALADAHMDMKEVQVAYSGAQNMRGQEIVREVGMTGIPVANVTNACATGSTAVREAFFAVASGAYDVGLAFGSEQMGKMGLIGVGAFPPGAVGEGVGGLDGAVAFAAALRAPRRGSRRPMVYTEGILGTNLMPGTFAMAGMEHMKKYGTTIEQFAQVSVKNHINGCYNPNAQYRIRLTLEEVVNARMVAYPNTLYMCCPTGDGAAAVIVCSMDKARQYTTKPIKIIASALSSDPYTQHDMALQDINSVTRIAAKDAYEQAGLGPEDLDLVELHDCFATPELLHYENLSLCPEGEAGRFVMEGHTEIDGKIPVNASGGLLAKGHPISATGVAQICEIVWQLRGVCGQRQVENAKVGLAHCIGLGTANAIHILQS